MNSVFYYNYKETKNSLRRKSIFLLYADLLMHYIFVFIQKIQTLMH